MADESVSLPQEEYFDNQATGVEVEKQDSEEESNQPWDPNKIRVSTKTFSIRNILDMIDEEGLELAPDFQRQQVWKKPQKSRLLESILLQIPLPAFYFSEDQDGKMRVVDGLQRLSTIHSFTRGGTEKGFTLADLEYLQKDADGKQFDELSAQWKRRIHNTQIVAHVIDPTTPPRVTYDIFKRINTGGSPLKPQEIRHCMSTSRSRDFLRSCIDLEEFDLATEGSLRNNVRMDDREVALRFCAFRTLGIDGYADPNRRGMDTFLMDATNNLDDPSAISDEKLESLKEEFRQAMRNARTVFGEFAFRKRTETTTGRNPINKPLFESWAVALADLSDDEATSKAPGIAAGACKAMTVDATYMDSISSATGDPRKVQYRFAKAAEVIQEA